MSAHLAAGATSPSLPEGGLGLTLFFLLRTFAAFFVASCLCPVSSVGNALCPLLSPFDLTLSVSLYD